MINDVRARVLCQARIICCVERQDDDVSKCMPTKEDEVADSIQRTNKNAISYKEKIKFTSSTSTSTSPPIPISNGCS